MNKSIQQERWIVLVLLLLPWLLFGQTIHYDFVWDDNRIHLGNNPYLNPMSKDSLLGLWTGVYKGLYIPAAYTAWGVLKTMAVRLSPGSDGAAVLHFVNVVLHSCNGVLVFALLKRFIPSLPASAAGALFFLVHPMQVESVAWISEFRGLGATLLMFSGLLIYIRACENRYANGRLRTYAVYAGIIFVLSSLAVLFKPSAVVMPLFAMITECYLFKKIRRESVFILALMAVPIFMVVWITASTQEANQFVPLWGRPFVWADAVNFYLLKLVAPFSLAASYARPPTFVLSQTWAYFLWIIPPVLTGIVLFYRKRHPLPLVAAGFFLAGFLPVSGLSTFFFQRWSTTADRYLYLSMLGGALFFAWLASASKMRWQRIGLLLLLLFWAGWSSFVQIPVWQNNFTLWNHCIQKTPREPMAYINRGRFYLMEEDYPMALADFTKAIELDSGYEEAYINRGIIYVEQGQYTRAMQDYNRAVELNPGQVEPYNNRGLLHLKQKAYSRAKDDFLTALALDPMNPFVLNGLGNVFKAAHEPEKALEQYNKAISVNPGYPDPYFNRGTLYLARKRPDLALADFSTVVRLNPGYEKAYTHMAAAYEQMNRLQKAVQNYDRALEINPENQMTLIKKGILHIRLKAYETALLTLNRAIETSPGSHDAYFHRGNAFQHQKAYEKALNDYNKAASLFGGNPYLYNNRSATYYHLKQYGNAVADLARVRELGGRPNPRLEALLAPYMDQ